MVPLTLLEYELNEEPELVLSRLKWAVEQVDIGWVAEISSKINPTTHKKWIGEIDERHYTFKLEEAGSYFKRKFNVVLKGRIEFRSSSTNVKIKLGIDNFTFLIITAFYLGIILFASETILDGSYDSLISNALFFSAYPVIGTFLIKHRMKNAERNLDILFS